MSTKKPSIPKNDGDFFEKTSGTDSSCFTIGIRLEDQRMKFFQWMRLDQMEVREEAKTVEIALYFNSGEWLVRIKATRGEEGEMRISQSLTTALIMALSCGTVAFLNQNSRRGFAVDVLKVTIDKETGEISEELW